MYRVSIVVAAALVLAAAAACHKQDECRARTGDGICVDNLTGDDR